MKISQNKKQKKKQKKKKTEYSNNFNLAISYKEMYLPTRIIHQG